MEKLTSSDAWILQTIAHASTDKPASLQDVIATGDMLNHAIFSAGELQNGFYKLYQMSWVQQDGGYYNLTDAGKKLLRSIIDKNLSSMNERDDIEALIKSNPWPPNVSLPTYNHDLNPRFFTLEDFNKACKKYQKEAWAIVKKITEK